MNKTNTPFRYDYVGSFLRPAALKQARADFQSGSTHQTSGRSSTPACASACCSAERSAGFVGVGLVRSQPPCRQ